MTTLQIVPDSGTLTAPRNLSPAFRKLAYEWQHVDAQLNSLAADQAVSAMKNDYDDSFKLEALADQLIDIRQRIVLAATRRPARSIEEVLLKLEWYLAEIQSDQNGQLTSLLVSAKSDLETQIDF